MSAKNQSHTPNINKHGLLVWLDTQYDSSIQPYSNGEGVTWVDLSGDYEDDSNNPNPDLSGLGRMVTGIKCDVSYPKGNLKQFGAGFTGEQSGGEEPAGRARGVRFDGSAGSQFTMPLNSSRRQTNTDPYTFGATPFIRNKISDGGLPHPDGDPIGFRNPIETPSMHPFTVELWFRADEIGHDQGLICGCPTNSGRTAPTSQEDSVFSIRYKSIGQKNGVFNVIKVGVGNGDNLVLDTAGNPDGPANAGKFIKWYETASFTQTRNRWMHLVVSNDPELVSCGGPNGQTTFDSGIRVWINNELDRPSYEKNFNCDSSFDTARKELVDIVQLKVGMAETFPTPLGDEDGDPDGRNWKGEIGCVRIYNWAFDEDQVNRHFTETKHRFDLGVQLGTP